MNIKVEKTHLQEMLHFIKFIIGSMKVYENYISIMLFSMYILYSLKKYEYIPYPQGAFSREKNTYV